MPFTTIDRCYFESPSFGYFDQDKHVYWLSVDAIKVTVIRIAMNRDHKCIYSFTVEQNGVKYECTLDNISSNTVINKFIYLNGRVFICHKWNIPCMVIERIDIGLGEIDEYDQIDSQGRFVDFRFDFNGTESFDFVYINEETGIPGRITYNSNFESSESGIASDSDLITRSYRLINIHCIVPHSSDGNTPPAA